MEQQKNIISAEKTDNGFTFKTEIKTTEYIEEHFTHEEVKIKYDQAKEKLKDLDNQALEIDLQKEPVIEFISHIEDYFKKEEQILEDTTQEEE